MSQVKSEQGSRVELWVKILPIWDDALCDLTDEDEEQHEGEQPAKVVSREVKPGAVMNVNLWTLAAPAFNKNKNKCLIKN